MDEEQTEARDPHPAPREPELVDDGQSTPAFTPAPGERGVVLYDPLRRYLAEIRHFQPLTAEEEHQLAVRYQETGDQAAAYRLVTAHLRLVVRIAFDFKRSWLNLLDLIQEGNVGLLLALRKFDPYRDIRLSTYASWWIRAYIIKFLLDNWRLVKVGTTNARRKLLFNLRKEKDALEAQGIVPTPKLLAARLDVAESDVIEVEKSLGVGDVSLDAPTSPDGDRTLLETLPSADLPVDQQFEKQEAQQRLRAKLDEFAAGLDERDRAVFHGRMLSDEPQTLAVLAERFGVTREGLRQVEKRLAKRLKEFLARELPELTPPELPS